MTRRLAGPRPLKPAAAMWPLGGFGAGGREGIKRTETSVVWCRWKKGFGVGGRKGIEITEASVDCDLPTTTRCGSHGGHRT